MTKTPAPLRLIVLPLACCAAVCACLLLSPARAAETLDLNALVGEALKNNPELSAGQHRVTSARHRIPQAKALPDPSVSAGYTNTGLSQYTFGNSYDALWAFGVSQTVPFPGKLVQKGRVAEKEMETLGLQLHALRLSTVARVKELYYDLFTAHRTIEILEDKAKLLEQVEKAALARYASGLGDQRDAVMAQTEKYMLAEKEQMVRQRLSTLEGMLNSVLGREVNSPLAKPAEPSKAPYKRSLEDLLVKASFDSPDTKARMKKVERAEAKVSQSKAEFVPDVTLSAGYSQKGWKVAQEPQAVTGPDGSELLGPAGIKQKWQDMWSAGVSVTVPLYFFVKQAEGLKESRADLAESRYDLEAGKNLVAAAIRENYAALQSAEKLSELFASGTLPKTRQDFQLAAASYAGGKGDIYAVVARLKSLLDYEAQYWIQLAEKQKAIARLESLAGFSDGLNIPKPLDDNGGSAKESPKEAASGAHSAQAKPK
ncbi:TolC family protein [Fundidesulfovibrio soli]|uniref:TolC family protein n=1 Tax=Fundidesulfovibrio soli TaxID=2922716 RepID=UPI001FAEB489|nr:TolC family protein [Fundidesulfovibrio soli]